MLTTHIVERLRQLKMPAAAAALETQLSDPKQSDRPFTDRLGDLIEAQWVQRSGERIGRLQRKAQLTQPPAIADICFKCPRGLRRNIVMEFAQCEWVRRHQNMIITGPTWAGKSFLASGFAAEALKNNLTVSYHRTGQLLEELQLLDDAAYRRKRCSLKNCSLLVLDDLAADTLPRAETQLLRNLIEDRHNRASTLVVSRKPCEDWAKRLKDRDSVEAMIKRLKTPGHWIKIEGQYPTPDAP